MARTDPWVASARQLILLDVSRSLRPGTPMTDPTPTTRTRTNKKKTNVIVLLRRKKREARGSYLPQQLEGDEEVEMEE